MTLEQRLHRAFDAVRDAIDTGRIPGAVLGVASADGARHVLSAGLAQRLPEPRPMQADTVFDLASLTKPLFTARRILEHADRGEIDLDAPLTSVIPDLQQYDASSWIRQVSFRDCLGHATAFPAVVPIYTLGDDPARLRAWVLQHRWPRGLAVYSDINFILLGIALERLSGLPIRELPTGGGLSFAADPERCAATEYCRWRERMLCGEVHDENCAALQGAGHAGLFGTADAVLDAALELLQPGDVSLRVIDWMRQPLSPRRTHGWERSHAGWSGGQACSKNCIGHTGFTGTGLWIDFEHALTWTLLTNRVHPSRHTDSGIMALRQRVGETLLGGAA